MGYRIDYAANRRKPTAATAGWLLAVAVLASIFWPRGREVLASALIPGDRGVTTGALENLAREVGAGDALGPALEDFCRRILEGQDGN